MTTQALAFLVVNDFCPFYDDLVAQAERANYIGIHSTGIYMERFCMAECAWAAKEIKERLGMDFDPLLAYFRQYQRGVDEVTYVHSDEAVADYGAILSLGRSGRENGAFRLWKHKETGLEVPDSEHRLQLGAEGLDDSKWQVEQHLELLPNRLIIYSARLFHSRHPRLWANEWPRTVGVYFFNERRN